MNISIKNRIQMGSECELIHEAYQGELTIKGDYHYLVYDNDEKEKVVLKFKSDELVMTRFSKPQSLMRFVANSLGVCTIPTPMGIQKMVTRSSAFQLEANSLRLSYQLLPYAEAEEAFADYDMEIAWSSHV